jgi:hypothetical protein
MQKNLIDPIEVTISPSPMKNGNSALQLGNYLINKKEMLVSEYKYFSDDSGKYIWIAEYKFRLESRDGDGANGFYFSEKQYSPFYKLMEMREKCSDCSQIVIVYKFPDTEPTVQPSGRVYRVKVMNAIWNIENNYIDVLGSEGYGIRFKNVDMNTYKEFLQFTDERPRADDWSTNLKRVTKVKPEKISPKLVEETPLEQTTDPKLDKLYNDLKLKSEKRWLKFNTERNLKYNIIMNGF